jgi:hypothetical protein
MFIYMYSKSELMHSGDGSDGGEIGQEVLRDRTRGITKINYRITSQLGKRASTLLLEPSLTIRQIRGARELND